MSESWYVLAMQKVTIVTFVCLTNHGTQKYCVSGPYLFHVNMWDAVTLFVSSLRTGHPVTSRKLGPSIWGIHRKLNILWMNESSQCCFSLFVWRFCQSNSPESIFCLRVPLLKISIRYMYTYNGTAKDTIVMLLLVIVDFLVVVMVVCVCVRVCLFYVILFTKCNSTDLRGIIFK